MLPPRSYRSFLCGGFANQTTTDGYKSLLIDTEGGDNETLVDEENGILIAAMLRQYFMALKVMGQWKNWGPSLDRHWGKVVSHVESHHPHHPPSPSSARRNSAAARRSLSPNSAGWDNWTAAKVRERRSSIAPLDEHVIENATYPPAEDQEDVELVDRELQIARRVLRKWCRLAGVHAKMCDELKEGEYAAEWTKAVAPRVEGRIRMVT